MKRIVHFLAPPVFAGDEEKTRTAYLLNVITISSFLAALIYGLIVPVERVLYAGLASGVILIVWLIMKRGHLWVASIILVISMFIIVAFIVITAGGVDATEYGAFVVPILFSGAFSIIIPKLILPTSVFVGETPTKLPATTFSVAPSLTVIPSSLNPT